MQQEFQAVVDRLKQAGSLLVVCHARPDGDALGSLLGLALSARASGRMARMLAPDRLPAQYDFLFPAERPAGREQFAALADEADLVVIVDTSTFGQLDGLKEHLEPRRRKVAVMDHHQTSAQVGQVQWVDVSAAATALMVQEALEHLGWPMDAQVVHALGAGITSDTGWLRFENTDPRCLEAMSRLVRRGLELDKLYRQLYQNDRPEKLKLLGRALESLEMQEGGRLAMMSLRNGDFDSSGARQDETENLVNEALRIGGVEVAVLMVELGHVVRVSLRSREHVDVSRIAQPFGGGGHARAAGLRSTLPLAEIHQQVAAACQAALRGQMPS